MKERNKLRIKLWMRDASKLVLFFLFFPLSGLLIYFWLFQDSTPIRGERDKALLHLEEIIRAQQAYFFETGSFADSYAELEITPLKSEHYQLTIEPENKSVFVYATAEKSFEELNWLLFSREDRHKPLNGYVSGVVYIPDYGFQKILCMNKTPGKHKPQQPKLIDNKLVCSQETKEIE